MRTTLVILFLGLFSVVGRAQSKIDSLIITYKNVNSVSAENGAYVNDGSTEHIADDEHNLVFTRIDIQTPNSVSLTCSDSKTTRQVFIQYNSLLAIVDSISYNRMGVQPGLIIDSSFELLHLSMHHIGDHFHSEFHGMDAANHINVKASGHHDGGSFGTYDQNVAFKATDSSSITIDLYANILSGVPEESSLANNHLTVYPSVATDHVTLSLPINDINTMITLSDAVGRELATYRTAGSTVYTIHLSSISQGLYVIRDSKGESARFLVAR